MILLVLPLACLGCFFLGAAMAELDMALKRLADRLASSYMTTDRTGDTDRG